MAAFQLNEGERLYASLWGVVLATANEEEEENSLLFRPYGMHAVCELLGLLEVWQLALHPYHVRIRRIRYCAVDGTPTPALVPIITLPRSWRVPVPVDVDAC